MESDGRQAQIIRFRPHSSPFVRFPPNLRILRFRVLGRRRPQPMAKKKKASQNEEVANTSEPSTLDGSISNEALARRVIEGVRFAKLTAGDLLELRQRFAKLKKNENILGYHRNEWEKFCDDKLGMTPSKARRWIRETCNAIGVPTPGSKHDGSKHRKYCPAPPTWHVFPAFNERSKTPSKPAPTLVFLVFLTILSTIVSAVGISGCGSSPT